MSPRPFTAPLRILVGALILAIGTPAARSEENTIHVQAPFPMPPIPVATFPDHLFLPLAPLVAAAVAAEATSTLRVGPFLMANDLRSPAVLAKELASLDLLSGGRVELGLGAGAFWDAIVATGGRRLAPGEAVGALEEAITIIREVWDADQRGGVRLPGEHYRVVGAKRGPAPRQRAFGARPLPQQNFVASSGPAHIAPRQQLHPDQRC